MILKRFIEKLTPHSHSISQASSSSSSQSTHSNSSSNYVGHSSNATTSTNSNNTNRNNNNTESKLDGGNRRANRKVSETAESFDDNQYHHQSLKSCQQCRNDHENEQSQFESSCSSYSNNVIKVDFLLKFV